MEEIKYRVTDSKHLRLRGKERKRRKIHQTIITKRNWVQITSRSSWSIRTAGERDRFRRSLSPLRSKMKKKKFNYLLSFTVNSTEEDKKKWNNQPTKNNSSDPVASATGATFVETDRAIVVVYLFLYLWIPQLLRVRVSASAPFVSRSIVSIQYFLYLDHVLSDTINEISFCLPHIFLRWIILHFVSVGT